MFLDIGEMVLETHRQCIQFKPRIRLNMQSIEFQQINYLCRFPVYIDNIYRLPIDLLNAIFHKGSII